MYYRIRPPKRFVGRQLKNWYRRLCSGEVPINWREQPALYVEDKLLAEAVDVLHRILPPMQYPNLSLRTYRP